MARADASSRRKTSARHGQRRHYRKWKDAVFAVLGHICRRCGFSDKRALQIDHIHGDGVADRLRFKRGSQMIAFFKNIVENSERYQILCANCNWIKRAENQEHTKRIDDVAA